MRIKKIDRKKESDPQRRLEKKLFWKFDKSTLNNHEVPSVNIVKKYQRPIQRHPGLSQTAMMELYLRK